MCVFFSQLYYFSILSAEQMVIWFQDPRQLETDWLTNKCNECVLLSWRNDIYYKANMDSWHFAAESHIILCNEKIMFTKELRKRSCWSIYDNPSKYYKIYYLVTKYILFIFSHFSHISFFCLRFSQNIIINVFISYINVN